MMERVIVTVEKDDQMLDLEIPLSATPVFITQTLGWEDGFSVLLPRRGVFVDAGQRLEGNVQDGERILFTERPRWRQ